MRHVWMHEGQPMPSGTKAGQFGITIFYDDGRPNNEQNVYADSHQAMADKLITMYANTNARLQEVKRNADIVPRRQSSVAAPKTLTADESLQLTADLDDPARAPHAIVKAIESVTGVNLTEDAILRRLREESEAFVEENPDYHATPRNSMLLRDRTIARDGDITKEGLKKSFIELTEIGALESAPSGPGAEQLVDDPDEEMNTPGATPPMNAEPSAPPPHRTAPRPSTGARPSQFSRSTTAPPAAPAMTYQQVLNLAASNPDEYARRLREEPGFAATVNKVSAPYQR